VDVVVRDCHVFLAWVGVMRLYHRVKARENSVVLK